ncbi:RNA polymerase II-associated protein 1 [Aricia agestis]|uniref:RNA polymerase II-associated protein 1 n=1 Tax=Aricia agestis TaxID=91739 RepID=UPI001C202D03|nr:RNA polymerase II-associated protein 1 [Aricia agestis]
MIKRPKPGENEEDILKMQEEFLKDKNMTPSAQIVNLRKTEHNTTKRNNSDPTDTRQPSKYAISRGLGSEKRPRKAGQPIDVMGDIVEKNSSETQTQPNKQTEDDKVYFPKVLPSILGEIIEKNSDNIPVNETVCMPSTGFPIATKHKPSVKFVARNSKKTSATDVDEPACSSGKPHKEPNILKQSCALTPTDAQAIHKENVSLLSKMSEQEILEEQTKLLAQLDPNLIQFLKNKHKSKFGSVNEPAINKTTIQVEKMETEVNKTNSEDTLWDNDVLSHPRVNSWLHFDNLEKDKLEWMKGIKESQLDKPDEPYEARFDFTGYLLPYTMEYTEKTKTLFHHGQESHRPGYSVPELFELTRSSVIQQRVMALNALAGLLEHNSTGIYTDVIDVPVTKIFFVIRIALDENKVNLLEPSLKALRNLIYNRVDEACLDALIGFEEGIYQPCLENDRSEIEEIESHESELKDFHLAEIDIIAALIRSDILQRLYYIIENVRPSFNSVQYALQVLTRLARDSVDTCTKIVQMDHLMKSVIKSFIPTTSINFLFNPEIVYNGKPVLAALKLLRIISLQSKEIGEIIISKYDILKPLSAYVTSGVDGTYGLRLQIEAFSILTNLLNYELGIENAMSLCPVIVTTLYKHVQGTDVSATTSILSATHAAVVLQYVNKLITCTNLSNLKEQIYHLLREGLQKWVSQVANCHDYTCGHLRLVSSLLDCCKTVIQVEEVQFKFLDDLLINLVNSNGAAVIFKNLISSSNLLSDIDDKYLYTTKNIMSLGTVLTTGRRILPVLQVSSPIPFLLTLFKLLEHIDNKDITLKFINRVKDYIDLLTKRQLFLTSNWFSRMEVELVYYIVKLAATVDTSEACKDVMYTVASKLCYILRVDKKCELLVLFENIIFEKQWFTAQRLFNLVSLSEADGFSKTLTNIEDIKNCYGSVMNLKHIHSRNIVLKDWREPILPRDWIYLPILSLYSRSQEMKPTPVVQGEHATKVAELMAKEKELVVKCCLEWTIFNEMCFPDLLSDIDVTDRFCRIMCVFLCDNSLFLDNNVKLLLHRCTQIIFKQKEKLNFDKELVGLHNFQDLYTQFLEQFQSVSYGDSTFAACVLVPIAQKHDVKWRKLLWSEYAGCLRALDCPETMMCYSFNEYIHPEETDESLLKSYFRALSSNLLRPGTISFKIAHYHVQKFIERKNSVQ